MKLQLVHCIHNGVMVVYCSGRIVYREEALQLSRRVSNLLQSSRQLVLEFSGIEAVDSAGLGQLAVILMWAQACRCDVRMAAPRRCVRELLELTNLASVVEMHPTLDEALSAFRERVA